LDYRSVVKACTPPIILDGYRELKIKLIKAEVDRKRDHRTRVGGIWDEVGQLQIDFIMENGLLPHHRLLDIGCGSLRGGVHFVKFLDNSNYYGMDKHQWLLDAALEAELPQAGLAGKDVNLLCRDDFDFSAFGMEFDYAIAQSVFTHLTWNSILRCLMNVERVLKKDGKFYATFFDVKKENHGLDPIVHMPGNRKTYIDKDPYHYEFDVFVELARRVSLEVEYIGKWGHPRNQMMMMFTNPNRKSVSVSES